MKQYIDIVKNVLNNGKVKKPVRKNHQTNEWELVDGGVSTLACPNVCFSHDMSDGFPLLTTKSMAWKSIRVELEGFIKGITDKKWYQERGCKIWNEWGNPQGVQKRMDDLLVGPNVDELETQKKLQQIETDLGPIYGYQWRHFDEHYGGDATMEERIEGEMTGVDDGADQLKNIVDALLNNPMDRRMVCSAWNPNQIHMMALPPCHYSWNVTVIGDELNLFWAQRSCDLMLGVPFNIASYGLLLCLLAKTAGFKPGNLSGMLVDCHIYENQIQAAQHQITLEPRPLPNIEFGHESGNIFDWTHKDVGLIDYNPLPKIDFGKVAV